jgi:xanthine dehydrogenase accessory factor
MELAETARVLAAAHEVRAAGGRAALATVVRVKGHAYRREGARMLVRENGAYECLLSGGCLEPAVVDAAKEVIASGVPRVVAYQLDDDVVWGLGIGCGGAVDIRIERLEDDEMTRRWLRVLEGGAAAVRVTPLSGATGRVLVEDGGAVHGHLDEPGLEARAVVIARQRLQHPHPTSATLPVGDAELFFEVSAPPPALTIFGAGHDAIPVVQRAREAGFSVTVVDVRSAYLTPDRFAGAQLVLADTGAMGQRVRLSPRALVVVMNHHLVRDRESLRLALEAGAQYIGVLGPRSRYDSLLEALAGEEGYVADPARLAAVRNPVGLALGAETPEEVALSIVGELLAAQRGFGGGFLSGTAGSIHTPPDAARAIARA